MKSLNGFVSLLRLLRLTDDAGAGFHTPLRLVQPIDDRVYTRYDYVAVDLYRNPHQTPHMVVRWNDTVFTTVMVFLERI